MGADADEDGFAFLPQLLERDVLAHDDAALQLDAEVQDPLDFRIQDFAGQAVFGNAVAQHAARLTEGFIDRDLKTAAAQLIGAG